MGKKDHQPRTIAPSTVPLSKSVTTRTLAQAAGVNVSTISRALRGAPGVSPAERERIRAIAKRLGYRPNPLVAILTAQVRTYRRNPYPSTIALLDCWPENRPIWANFDDSLDYIGGIRDRAESLGYSVERIRMIDLGGSLGRLQKLLATRRIYGLLVLPVPDNTDLSGLDFSQLACATIDFSLNRPNLMLRASPNYYHNMWTALTIMVDRGYRRIGFADTQGVQYADSLAYAAFLVYSKRHPGLCVAPCLANSASYKDDLATWLHREKPDALLTSNFNLPADIVAAGYRVPQDIAAVSLCSPPDPTGHVTYIDENYRAVGAQATAMIIDAIHRNEFGLLQTGAVYLVDGIWHEGRTVRPAPVKSVRRSPRE